MNSYEMKAALADLLVWRTEAELRLANNQQQLKDLQEWDEASTKFEHLSYDFQDVAWVLVTNLLHHDFGMNASASWIGCYVQGKQDYSTGAIVWDSPSQRHEAYLVRVHRYVEPWVIDELTECLRKFHKRTDSHLNDRKAFGVIVTTPDTSEEIREKVLQAGFYLAIVRDNAIRLAVPPNFIPKEFGVATKKKRKKEIHK